MRRWLATFGCALTLVLPARAEPWVVLVGIDDYVRETITDLKFACEDAKLLNQAVAQLLHVPKERVFLFSSDSTDASQTPTVTNIVFRLDWLRKNAQPGDSVVFFFAGHGVTVDGESFLLTEESDNRSLETLKRSALGARDLSSLLRSSPASRTLMILDACRNDPGGKVPASRPLEPALYGAVSLASPDQENATLYSCNVGERSWEWEQKKHGYFSYYLYEGLRQGAVQGDGQVTLQSLQDYLLRTVPAETKSHAGAVQTPRLAYEGPSPQRWVLARSSAPPTLAPGAQGAAQLDAAQARQDLAQAERARLQSKLELEETRRKQAEARLDEVEKQLASRGGDDVQKLTVARDLALQEVVELRKQLEGAKLQLAARGGSNAELDVLVAERESLKAENKLLQAKVSLLEGKLQQQGVSYSRAVTVETPSPTTDPRADIEALLRQSEALRRVAAGCVDAVVQALASANLELEKRLLEIDTVARPTEELQTTRLRAVENAMQAAEIRWKIDQLRGDTPEAQWSRLAPKLETLQAQLDARERDNLALRGDRERLVKELEAVLQVPRYRQVWISRRFHEINRLPGMGDILDVPVKTGPEAQSL